MYSTIKLPNPSNCLKKLSSTNSYYASSISLLLNKKSVYIILVFFSDIRSRCLIYNIFRLCIILVLFSIEYACYIVTR